MTDEIPTAKVIVLGNSCVGKTSIVIRFGRGIFDEEKTTPTIGAAYVTRQVTAKNQPLNIHLWDTAGQERFRSIIPMYVRGCSAVLLICSTDNEESVGELDVWTKVLKDNAPEVKTVFLVLNKIDIKNERLQTAAKEFARVNDYQYREVSAKEDIGIMELFKDVGEAVIENGDNLLIEKLETVQTINDNNKKNKDKKCC